MPASSHLRALPSPIRAPCSHVPSNRMPSSFSITPGPCGLPPCSSVSPTNTHAGRRVLDASAVPRKVACCPSIQPSELELNETAKRCLRRPAAAVCGTFRPRRRSHAWLSAASAACLSGHPFPGMGVQLSTNALVRSTSSRKTLSPVVSECRRCQACLSSV